ILKDAAFEAMRIAQARRAEEPPPRKLDPGGYPFIDALRRVPPHNRNPEGGGGAGTFPKKAGGARPGAPVVSYQKPPRELGAEALRRVPYALARLQLDEALGQAHAEMRAAGATPERRRDLLAKVLAVVVTYRTQLFDFGPDDRYNFVVHKRRGDRLRVFPPPHAPGKLPPHRRGPEARGA